MKMIAVALLSVVIAGCAGIATPPSSGGIVKANYTGRDFTKENPNDGFPTVSCDQCGEGGEVGVGDNGGTGL